MNNKVIIDRAFLGQLLSMVCCLGEEGYASGFWPEGKNAARRAFREIKDKAIEILND